MSDTVTLIAGILLTSVGLLALLPYSLKRGWRRQAGDLAVNVDYASVKPALDIFFEGNDEAPQPTGASKEDIEELLAQLFSLRLTVSDVAAEVQETHQTLGREGKSPGLAGEVA